MSLAARQAVLARFLTDASFEERVRSEPERVCSEVGVELEYVGWLAAIAPARVAAFRASREVKDLRRSGGG